MKTRNHTATVVQACFFILNISAILTPATLADQELGLIQS